MNVARISGNREEIDHSRNHPGMLAAVPAATHLQPPDHGLGKSLESAYWVPSSSLAPTPSTAKPFSRITRRPVRVTSPPSLTV